MTGDIIAVFSNCGKTHYVLNNYSSVSCVDHDFYDWMYRGNLGDDWLKHYINRMGQLRHCFDYTFINVLPEILNILPFESLIVYPNRDLKDEWVARATNRGGSPKFPLLLNNKWDEWITACENYKGENHIVLQSGEYLSDVY